MKPLHLFTATAALVFGLDQLTKWLALKHLMGHPPITLVPGCLQLSFTVNTGAAWGMLGGRPWLLGLLGIAAMLYIVLKRKSLGLYQSPALCAALAAAFGGIAGNTLDRLARGHVIDFIDAYWGGAHWPMFNIADSALVLGIPLYIYINFKLYKR